MIYLKRHVPNKIEDLNLIVLQMIIGINESKTLTTYISCKCKCRFDERKCNSDQWCNSNKFWCDCKNHHVGEKYYIWNVATFSCENRKYLACIMDCSAITCD